MYSWGTWIVSTNTDKHIADQLKVDVSREKKKVFSYTCNIITCFLEYFMLAAPTTVITM